MQKCSAKVEFQGTGQVQRDNTRCWKEQLSHCLNMWPAHIQSVLVKGPVYFSNTLRPLSEGLFHLFSSSLFTRSPGDLQMWLAAGATNRDKRDQ